MMPAASQVSAVRLWFLHAHLPFAPCNDFYHRLRAEFLPPNYELRMLDKFMTLTQ